MATDAVLSALQERFADLRLAPYALCTYLDGRSSGQMCVRVPSARLIEVMRFLRDDPRCRMEQLSDVTCVDYLNFPDADDRFGVTYSLLSLTHNHRLWVKCFANDPEPTVPSLCSVWPGAEWTEREVYDLFGVRFDGHPDLRRIVCPDWFTCHPLRKDYPLTGQGERERFPVLTTESA